MKKNLKTLVERPRHERPHCLVNMNRMELVEACGLKVDLRHKRSAHLSGRWNPLELEKISLPLGSADLSPFSYITFAIFAEAATGMLLEVFFDNSEAGDKSRGYVAEVKLESKGWNFFALKFSRLTAVGAPAGWKSLSSIHLSYKKGRRLQGSALYLDNFYLWEGEPPKLYELLPDLGRAVVFSEFGNYALVRGKRVANSPFGNATPMQNENDGEIWLPFTPIVAASVRSAEADSKAKSLAFTYRKQRYVFAADKPWALVDGERKMLRFAPMEQNGALLVPASYAASFFSRKFSLAKDGIFVLSNRKNWFLKAGKQLRNELLAATAFSPIDPDALSEKLLKQFSGSTRPRLLFGKEELNELRKDLKTNPASKVLYNAFEMHLTDPKSSATANCLASIFLYLGSGKKKLVPQIKELAEKISLNLESLAAYGRSTYVLALAYDALRPALTEAEKAEIERKLLRSSLRPGIAYYAGEGATAPVGSLASRSLAAGMTTAALAMMDAYPETARRLLAGALEALQIECLAFDQKKPGGKDLLLAVRALTIALGDDCGCLATKEIREAYEYLFLRESRANTLLRVYQATLTKQK